MGGVPTRPLLLNHNALFEVVGRAPAVRFICTRPETTLARYRRLFITFIFIQFSKHSGQEVSERGAGVVHPLKL